MNRFLTSLVQIALLVPALIGVRAMWEWLKEDVRELTRQVRRVGLTMSRSARSLLRARACRLRCDFKHPEDLSVKS